MHSKWVAISIVSLFAAGLVAACESESFDDAPTAKAPKEPMVSPKKKKKGRGANRGEQVPSGHPPVQGGGAQKGSSPQPSGNSGELPVKWEAPDGWKKVKPSSSMRKAQYRVPGAEEAGAATLAVFHFPGSEGKIQANIDRWIGQFQPPGDAEPSEVAETETRRVDGAKVHVVHMRGAYKGMRASEVKEDYRLLAAIVETDRGPVFFKMVGPAPTVAAREKEFDAFVGSFTTGS